MCDCGFYKMEDLILLLLIYYLLFKIIKQPTFVAACLFLLFVFLL